MQFAGFPIPTGSMRICITTFAYRCPGALREHRAYFKQAGRGFGEDAFHAMWWLILKEFRPTQLLEIGVYRGQTISLWALIGRLLSLDVEVSGISPFCAAGDSVSRSPIASIISRISGAPSGIWALRNRL